MGTPSSIAPPSCPVGSPAACSQGPCQIRGAAGRNERLRRRRRAGAPDGRQARSAPRRRHVHGRPHRRVRRARPPRRRGHRVRNAGGRVTEDVLRSLALASHALGVDTVVVMQHTKCGLTGVTDEELQELTGADVGFLAIDDHAGSLDRDLDTLSARLPRGDPPAGRLRLRRGHRQGRRDRPPQPAPRLASARPMSDRLVAPLHPRRRRARRARHRARGEGAYVEDTEGNRYLDALSGPVRRRRSATVAGSWPRPPPARPSSSPSSRCGATPTRPPSRSPTASSTWPPPGSTACSSPPAAARPSSRPGSSSAATSSSRASPSGTRSSPAARAYHGTTLGALADHRASTPSASPSCRCSTAPASHAANTNRPLLARRAAPRLRRRDRAGHPRATAPRPSPRCSSSRCRTPAAACPRRPATSSGCARSATATACCSCPTRSSAASAGWGVVRRRAARLPARPHHLRQGRHLGLRARSAACSWATTSLEPFRDGPASFPHGITFGGHPVSCAVGLANLDVMERRGPPRPGCRQRGRPPGRPRVAARPAPGPRGPGHGLPSSAWSCAATASPSPPDRRDRLIAFLRDRISSSASTAGSTTAATRRS